MKKLLCALSAVSVLLFNACGPKEQPSAVAPALIIGDPLNIGNDTSLLFPVGVSYYDPKVTGNPTKELDVAGNKVLSFSSRESGLLDNNATREYYNQSEEDSDIRNILFYNLNKKTSKPLLNDTLHILSFAIHHEFARPCILYRMVRHDINQDKKYNSMDPVMLYTSNLEGDSLVQITPASEKFSEYFYYPKQNIILVKTIIDSDGDKLFSSLDETNMLEVDLLNPQLGKEIFDGDLKESLKGMLK